MFFSATESTDFNESPLNFHWHHLSGRLLSKLGGDTAFWHVANVTTCAREPRVLQGSSKGSHFHPEIGHMTQSTSSEFLTHTIGGHDPPAPWGSWVRTSTSGSYCLCWMISAQDTRQKSIVNKGVLQMVRDLRTQKLLMGKDGAGEMDGSSPF